MITDRDEMSTLYRGPAIDASYEVSVHLAKWFQRRRFLKIGQSETRIAYPMAGTGAPGARPLKLEKIRLVYVKS